MNKSLLTLSIIVISATIMFFISVYFQTKTITCTEEARICPDGFVIYRKGPSCEFASCPTAKIKQIITPSSIPDNKNECPKTQWIDCMPGPNKTKSECNPQYLKWAKENCPNFKGVAY